MIKCDTLKDFESYLDDLCSETITQDELEALYQQPITITFSDHTIDIPFNGYSYQALYCMISNLICINEGDDAHECK